jgi:hypothetical protein
MLGTNAQREQPSNPQMRQLYKAMQDAHNDLCGNGWNPYPASSEAVLAKMKAALISARSATIGSK